MRHVFVETNWLVQVAAPAHNRDDDAVHLLDQAQQNLVRIYLPACCIAEARKAIRQKFQPKESDRLWDYLRWAEGQRHLDGQTVISARKMLQSFVQDVKTDLGRLSERLRQVSTAPGVEIMPLDDKILNLCVELYFIEIEPSDFDRAVLAAVLTKGKGLNDAGVKDVNFCQLDSKMWPWEKKKTDQPRRPRPELKRLYDSAGVWVYSDFELKNPKRPADFPSTSTGE